MLTLFVFTTMMMEVFVNFNVDTSAVQSFIRYNDGHDPLMISTDEVIPAMQIVSLSNNNSTMTISDYVMGLEIIGEKKQGSKGFALDFKKRPLRLCKEVYPTDQYPA
mmetsp:Transcript_9749/g.12023  ORF Transcript_9749/g.12023 Transcript_9749/m.12023 type:complete len:107 (+) Transcript_9749:152-472(+)